MIPLLMLLLYAGLSAGPWPDATRAFAAERLTLEQALDEARRANPELRALQAQANATLDEASTSFYLPSPMLSLGSMGMTGPFSSDSHMQTSIQITQEIPFPAKISGRRKALRQNGLAAQSAADARAVELESQVRRSYLDYWRARETITLLEEKQSVLTNHVERLKAGSLQTQLMQAHLVSVGTDLEILKTELEAARARKTASRGELNALMGRDAFEPLPPPSEELPLSPLPPAPDNSQIQQALGTHPEIHENVSMIQAAEAELSAARSEWLPDFSLAYRHNSNTSLAADPSNSEFMVGMTLPFAYFWQPAAANRAASSRLVAAEARLDAKKNNFKLRLLRQHAEMASLRAQYERFRDSVLKSAQKRLHIAHGIAPSDNESLMEHRESTEKAVELKLKTLDLRVEYEKAVAEYRSALGDSLGDSKMRKYP